MGFSPKKWVDVKSNNKYVKSSIPPPHVQMAHPLNLKDKVKTFVLY